MGAVVEIWFESLIPFLLKDSHIVQWLSEPPEGKLMWSKSWDEEEMAANFIYASPEAPSH